MEYNLDLANEAVERGNIAEGIEIVNHILNEDSKNIKVLMFKATILYKQQKWGDTLNVLNSVLELDSAHQAAKNYKLMVMNILSFWNKDSYNP